MLSRFRVMVTSEQRLVWSELLQWLNLIFVFFVVIQLALAVGVWIVSGQVRQFLLGHNPDVLPSLILISCILTIIMVTVGYNGALHSASPNADERFYSVKRLMWFELLGSLLAVLCLVLGVTGFTVVHGDILWAAERGLKSDMSHYSSTPAVKEKIDRLQTEYKCCGITSYRDWFGVPWQKYTAREPSEVEDSVPWSCCSPDSTRPCVHFSVTQNIIHKAYTYPSDLTLHVQGCVAAITQYLGHHMFYVCGGLMLFISFALMSMVLWTRLLETSITNAYRIGDPDHTTWGYFLINYGPDIEDLYDEVPQSSEEYDEESTLGSDVEDEYEPDSDLGDTSEEILAVSSPIGLPTELDEPISQGSTPPADTSEKTTTTVTTSSNDNNNRSPNNNDDILNRYREASNSKHMQKPRLNKTRRSTKQPRKGYLPLPPPPLPPPPPPNPKANGEMEDYSKMPPLPPLPFQ